MLEIHRLLKRQLKKYLGDFESLPENLKAFVEAVNDAYGQAEEDRTRLERTLAISSEELLTANNKLKLVLQDVEQQVADRTQALSQSNADLQATLSELKETQLQLLQQEKMSSLGQLVAGVAHEINNPINFISSNLPYVEQYAHDFMRLIQVYQLQYPQSNLMIDELCREINLDFLMTDLGKILASMRVGTERIQEIVLSLRNFSRLDEAEMKPVYLQEGLDSTLMILSSRLKTSELSQSIAVIQQHRSLPKIHCYAGQLNQVFMNLLVNAIDALEECPKFQRSQPSAPEIAESSGTAPFQQGTASPANGLSLPSTAVLSDPTLAWLQQWLQQEQQRPSIWIRSELLNPDWLQVQIIDNASGIPERVKNYLFDPFFTTKPIGKGTGLGLSISYSIVTDRHGGQLSCHSLPGQGTLFTVKIPTRQPIPSQSSNTEISPLPLEPNLDHA
ncbi:sensor histidine kinase [Alkalinema pantanalense CENA528]|uniref:sensor histidine kinase n=1 Tax=Alkalinema pantanalense TaxID=1620705 RepID=UPI003D6FF42B